MRLSIILILLGLLCLSNVAYAQEASVTIPSNLTVPEGHVAFLNVIGEGVQVYRCEENSEVSGTYRWVFVEPQASLHTEINEQLGIHYVGPSWEANDGSVVIGEVLARASVDNSAIPWLLLQSVSTKGTGIFSHVSFIQRIDTLNGLAPSSDSCDKQHANQLSQVPYLARYIFYSNGLPNDPTVNPDANACFEGGSLEGQCGAQDLELWRCGWYQIRLENRMISDDYDCGPNQEVENGNNDNDDDEDNDRPKPPTPVP